MPDPQSAPHRVLVMDDDPQVRGVAKEVLQFFGYEVELAEHGQEAVDLYREALERGRKFAAVIVDLNVPGKMSGADAVHTIVDTIDPEVRAILSSGSGVNQAENADLLRGFRAVVRKPYQIHDLARTIEDVISGRHVRPV